MLRNNVSRFSTAIKYTAERKFEGKNTETQYTFILVLLSHYYFLVLLCTFKQFYWFIFLVIYVWIPTKKVRRRQIRSFGCFFFFFKQSAVSMHSTGKSLAKILLSAAMWPFSLILMQQTKKKIGKLLEAL